MSTDLLVLPDILVLGGRRSHQGPERPLLRLPDIEEAGADRRQQPLVETGAVVVAVEVIPLEREVGKGMGAVHEHFDAERPGKGDQLLHRHDVAAQVRDVGNLDDPGAGSHRSLEPVHDLLLVLRRNGERNLVEHDAIPADALLPGGDHSPVVLVGDHHLIALLEVETENHDLVGLGGVAGDGHFLGIAAELAGQVAAHALHPGLEHPPHMVDRQLIGKPEIPDHLLEHVGRRGAAAAVVEIDQGAVVVERPLDFAPVVLVIGQEACRFPFGRPVGVCEVPEGMWPEGGEREARAGQGADERTAVRHESSRESGRSDGCSAGEWTLNRRGFDLPSQWLPDGTGLPLHNYGFRSLRFEALPLRPMAGQRTLDPSMVVRVHQGQWEICHKPSALGHKPVRLIRLPVHPSRSGPRPPSVTR